MLLAWAALIAIVMAEPDVYDRALQLQAAGPRQAGLAFLAAIPAFIAVLAAGVVRRWRWTFWLLVVAFVAGALRVPAALLQLTGWLEPAGPTWSVVFQGVIGVAQLVIGVALLVGYRKAGVWGAF